MSFHNMHKAGVFFTLTFLFSKNTNDLNSISSLVYITSNNPYAESNIIKYYLEKEEDHEDTYVEEDAPTDLPSLDNVDDSFDVNVGGVTYTLSFNYDDNGMTL